MKLFAPEYYKNFVCIADRCKHSCCVGWEIDIDDVTAEKYRSLCGPYAEKIRESIESDGDGVPHFRLAENERCPHLNASGLCKVILEYGDGLLCDICREHPRFYNTTARGMEVGLGMACEEACRIILGSDSYRKFVLLGESEGELDSESFETDALCHRERIFSILADASLEYTEKLKRIYEEYSLSPALFSDGDCRAILDSLEYLDEAHKELFSCYSSSLETPEKLGKILERALAYFVFRHLSPVRDQNGLREALCLCLFCERLLASLLKSKPNAPTEEWIELARIVSEEIEYSEDNTDAIKFEFSFLF
jgi:lysine-N-methylase